MAVHGGEHLGQRHDVSARQERPERLRVRLVAVLVLAGRGDRDVMAGGAAEERIGAVRYAFVGRHVLSVQCVIEFGEHLAGIDKIAKAGALDQCLALAVPPFLADQAVVERLALGQKSRFSVPALMSRATCANRNTL